MHRPTPFPVLALLLALAACADAGEDPLAPRPEAADLEFAFPTLAAQEAPPPVPADAGPSATSEYEEVPATINNARTKITMFSNNAAFVASMDHTGNIAEMDITGTLAFEGKHLTSGTSRYAISEPFAAGFFESHREATGRIYFSQTCGIEANGGTEHRARFETLTPSLTIFGRVVRTSYANTQNNGACAHTNVGGSSIGRSAPPGVVCTYYITYDLETGVIYDATLLYCSSVGGDDLL